MKAWAVYLWRVVTHAALVAIFIALASGAETVGGTLALLACALLCARYLHGAVFGRFHDDIAP